MTHTAIAATGTAGRHDHSHCGAAALGGPVEAMLVRDLATVLFVDIEGFTRFTEALPLERTAGILGEFYEALDGAARTTTGTVDRFIGDGALIFWSRMRNGAAHADLALASVALLREAFGRGGRGRARIAGGLPVRFGIHTGEVIVGRLGAGGIAQTLVGDVVNLASRLQHAAKDLPGRSSDAGLRGYVSRDTVRHLSTPAGDLSTPAGEGAFERLPVPGRRRAVLAQRM